MHMRPNNPSSPPQVGVSTFLTSLFHPVSWTSLFISFYNTRWVLFILGCDLDVYFCYNSDKKHTPVTNLVLSPDSGRGRACHQPCSVPQFGEGAPSVTNLVLPPSSGRGRTQNHPQEPCTSVNKECLQCEQNSKKHTNWKTKRPKSIIKQCTHRNIHQFTLNLHQQTQPWLTKTGVLEKLTHLRVNFPFGQWLGQHLIHPSKKKCFSIALRHTLVVLEMH